MSSLDWRSSLKSVAPTIGLALSGPLDGAAAKRLMNALDPEGKADAGDQARLSQLVSNALGDGGKLVQIQQAEHQFRSQMLDLGLDERALEEMAFRPAESRHPDEASNWTQNLIAIAVTFGFFGIVVSMLRIEVPEKSRDVLNIMIGALGTAWVSIVTYYFGSSAGSARKTDLLAQKSSAAKK